jgi:hypothetical protein
MTTPEPYNPNFMIKPKTPFNFQEVAPPFDVMHVTTLTIYSNILDLSI